MKIFGACTKTKRRREKWAYFSILMYVCHKIFSVSAWMIFDKRMTSQNEVVSISCNACRHYNVKELEIAGKKNIIETTTSTSSS